MTEDEWWEEFKPKQNEMNPDAPWNGTMFETYGEELDYVWEQDPQHTWTLVEAEGNQYILEGRHLVNRLGYFLTEKPWKEKYMEIAVEGAGV